MIINYNKMMCGEATIAGLVAIGAVLLGLGLAGQQIGSWGGHSWEVITGGTLLGVGVVGGLAISIILCLPQKKDYARAKRAMQKDERNEIWAYTQKGDKEVMLIKTNKGVVESAKKSSYNFIQKCYTRVLIR